MHASVRKMFVVAPVVLLVAVFAAQTVDAKIKRRSPRRYQPRYSQEGLALTIGLNSTNWESDMFHLNDSRERSGLTLGLSWGVSDNITLFGNLVGGGFDDGYPDDGHVGYLDVGIKATLINKPRNRFRPYISLSIGGAVFDHDLPFEPDREYLGGSARLAAGADIFLSRNTMLYLEIGGRSGEYERVYYDGDDCKLIGETDFTDSGVSFGLRFRL